VMRLLTLRYPRALLLGANLRLRIGYYLPVDVRLSYLYSGYDGSGRWVAAPG